MFSIFGGPLVAAYGASKGGVAAYPSIIDEDIEPAERGHGGCHHIAARHLVSHINGDRCRLGTRLTERSDGGFVLRLIATTDHNCGTSCGEPLSHAKPDAPVTAGYQSDAIRKIEKIHDVPHENWSGRMISSPAPSRPICRSRNQPKFV